MKLHVATFLILAISLFSCKKKEMTQSGSSGLAYRSSYEYPHEIRPVVFMDRIVLEGADPYIEMMGQVAKSANETTDDGKPVKFSEIQISNVRASTAVVNIVTQGTFMQDHLTNSKIVFKDMNTETTIATFSNCTSTKITYTISTQDLTQVFQNVSAGSFYIDFDFDSNSVPDNIKVYYDMFFNYDYTMKQYKK